MHTEASTAHAQRLVSRGARRTRPQTSSLNQLPEARNFTIQSFHPCLLKMKYPREKLEALQPSPSQHEPISQILSREAASRKKWSVPGPWRWATEDTQGAPSLISGSCQRLSQSAPGTQPKRGARPRAGQSTTVSCCLQPLALPRAPGKER